MVLDEDTFLHLSEGGPEIERQCQGADGGGRCWCAAFPILLGWSSLVVFSKGQCRGKDGKSSKGKKKKKRDIDLRRSERWIGPRVGSPGETGPSSKGVHYGNAIALSGAERGGRGHAGKDWEQHDVDAFFLDRAHSPQKCCLKYSVTWARLWFGESLKTGMLGSAKVCMALNSAELWCGWR